MDASSRVINTILRHDAMTTSFKVALVRALNDVALAYPDLHGSVRDVAIPLRQIAEFWLAYYWPFMDSSRPILQGARNNVAGSLRQDVGFRSSLTELRLAWEDHYGLSTPADGFALIQDRKLSRQRLGYPAHFLHLYDLTIREIVNAVKQPVQDAGGGGWSIFDRPGKLGTHHDVVAVPGTSSDEVCLIVKCDLWRAFCEASLWIEALCIHEWCLFTEGVDQRSGPRVSRGDVYSLLTERPQNRRPLTWERNQVEILMLEGYAFHCPWSRKALGLGTYDLDHIVPISVYPINDLWNLVPSDPWTNMHIKRARLPTEVRWQGAVPTLHHTYRGYLGSPVLGATLTHDVRRRFSRLQGAYTPEMLTTSVGAFLRIVADARNLSTF